MYNCLVIITYFSDGEESHGPSIDLNARAHIEQIESIFSLFNVKKYEYDWAVCQLAGNCFLNKSIAAKLEIPHVGCRSHKINIIVNNMILASNTMSKVLDQVKSVMRECKHSLKNSAMLARLIDLRPVLPSFTRWSESCSMINRYVAISEQLEQVADTQGLNLTVPRGPFSGSDVNEQVLGFQKSMLFLKDCKNKDTDWNAADTCYTP